MSAVREKAQGYTKQIIGEMIGDDLLVQEGKQQQRHADEQRDAPSPTQHAKAPSAGPDDR